MIERPDDLQAYVDEHAPERSGEYETRCAWVLEQSDGLFYTCKECGRVFHGPQAFAGHTATNGRCRRLRERPLQERAVLRGSVAAERAVQPWYRFW